jgi:hypothetical protein
MAGHGLSAGTLLHIAKQLLTERITGKYRWRRAVVLDRLQWDVFSWYFRRNRPDFNTFFLNSTAHFQHLYWRNMDPDAFRIRPGAPEQEEYADAVLYGYQQMDVLVGKAMALAGDTHAVVFSSALGQQPCLTYEESGGKAFYRPRDFRRFTAWAGLGMAHRVEPVMSEEFRLVFDNQADVDAAEAQLQSVVIDGEPGLRTRRIDMGLNVGCRLFRQVADDASMSAAGQRPARFADLFYRVEGMKSGMHHAEGCLWIRDPARPEHQSATGHVPLKSVAPTLLAMLGVDPSGWMDGEVLPEASLDARGFRRPARAPDAVVG